MPINEPKPTDSLATGWATDPDAREEPTSGQKESGWSDAQIPPFNVFNWILGVIYDWLAYFETATDELDAEKYEKTGGTITGSAVITVDLTVGDDLTVADNVIIGGTLAVGEDVTLTAALAVGTTAAVTGNTTIGGDLDVAGTLKAGSRRMQTSRARSSRSLRRSPSRARSPPSPSATSAARLASPRRISPRCSVLRQRPSRDGRTARATSTSAHGSRWGRSRSSAQASRR